MQIQIVSPTELIVTGPEALAQWRESRSLFVPGYRFSSLFKKKQWDGKHHIGSYCHKVGDHWEFRCKRGLLSQIVQRFPQHSIYDYNSYPAVSTVAAPETFRDFQRDAVRAAFIYLWCRVAYATNAGKGAVIAWCAKLAVDAGLRVLILCDERTVFDALSEEVGRWSGLQPALVEAGEREIPTAPVTIAMVPTLARRTTGGQEKSYEENKAAKKWRDWLSGVGMVLCDEADKATSAQWKKVLRNATGSLYRVGFSGSFPDPEEKPVDDIVLEELIGPIVLRVKNMELVEREISARPQVQFYRYETKMPDVPEGWRKLSGTQRRDWAFEKAIFLNAERHEFVRSLIEPNTRNVIIVNRIEHGQQLAAIIPNCVFMDGSVSNAKRREILEDFANGVFDPLIVTKVLDRGSNALGHAGCVIFASGEGSMRQTLQRIGRVLRRGPDGKQTVIVKDIIDTSHEYLQSMARQRIKLYNDEGFDVRIFT